MTEGENAPTPPVSPRTVGERLRAAREAQGLSLADVAARTRVTQRYLEAIETDRLDLLPSPAYASGFARAYARAVDLDQAAIGGDVRAALARGAMPARQHQFEEIADPARAPSRTTVIVAAGLALAVLVLGALWLASGMLRGTGEAPAAAPTVAQAPAATQPVARPAAAGQVVLTATDEVWMRVYDADDKTLFLGTMTPGQRFEVPADANQPMINVGRPDQLDVTLNGSKVAPLGDGRRAIKDVRISAAALAARGMAAGPAADTPSAAASPAAASPTARPSVPPAFATPTPRRETRATPRPQRREGGDDETRRANAAASAPAAAPAAATVTPPGVVTAPAP